MQLTFMQQTIYLSSELRIWLFLTNFHSNITVLVSYNVHDNVWQLWHFIREFPIAPMLNPSLKSRFM